jgi:hypothetical protein
MAPFIIAGIVCLLGSVIMLVIKRPMRTTPIPAMATA